MGALVMSEIERIARKLSDRWFVFTDFRYTFHWSAIVAALLSVERGMSMGECLMFSRKMEFASKAELAQFFKHVELIIKEQSNG